LFINAGRLCFKQAVLGFTVTAAAAAAAAAAVVKVAIDGGDADVNPTVLGNPQSGFS
jgi:hypothetical protein